MEISRLIKRPKKKLKVIARIVEKNRNVIWVQDN